MNGDQSENFALRAEVQGYEKPLYVIGLTFARLMDDIVVPYQTNERFFIDGVPTTAKTLVRIKIIRQTPEFDHDIQDLHWGLKAPMSSGLRVSAADYPVRLSALFLDRVEDVTAQVIKAYQETIGDRLKEYLPNKTELIQAAAAAFNAGLKLLGTHATGPVT